MMVCVQSPVPLGLTRCKVKLKSFYMFFQCIVHLLKAQKKELLKNIRTGRGFKTHVS